jgi:hypothetical protein
MKWDTSEAAIDKLCRQLQGYLTNDDIASDAVRSIMQLHGDVLQTCSYWIDDDYAHIKFVAWDGRKMDTSADLRMARVSGNPVKYVADAWWFLCACTLGFYNDSYE